MIGLLSTLLYSDKNGNAINKFVDSSGPYTTIPGYTEAETTEIYNDIIGVFCDIGSLGDMFQVGQLALAVKAIFNLSCVDRRRLLTM